MKTSLITTENIDFLDCMFPQFRPQLSKINFIGTISAFTFFFESENDLNDNWKAITSSIATYYQAEFEGEETNFERWNIYIFFLVKEPVGTQLKYKIENNKFSSRKIVQDQVADIQGDFIHQLINEYIINDDITITASENMETVDLPSGYTNASEIYEIIDNSRLRASGKKMATKDEIETLYQQIVKQIEDEIQKSRDTGF